MDVEDRMNTMKSGSFGCQCSVASNIDSQDPQQTLTCKADMRRQFWPSNVPNRVEHRFVVNITNTLRQAKQMAVCEQRGLGKDPSFSLEHETPRPKLTLVDSFA
jgi:hypothetical protein